jgi:hypothetical protein
VLEMLERSYSENFRRQAVQKMYSRGSKTLSALAGELGCSVPTLYNWAKVMKIAHISKSSAQWTPMERCKFIAEFEQIPEENKGVWLRKNGLTSALISEWKEILANAFQERKIEPGSGKLRREVEKLEQQLKRKERKLFQSERIIEVQKKVLELFGENQEE